MNDKETIDPAADHEPGPRRNGHGLSRRARLGVAAALLLGIGAVAGSLATVSVSAGAHLFRGHHDASSEAMSERARDRVASMLGRVDATPEQARQVEAIVTDLLAQLAPVRDEHRQHRRELSAELLRDAVDPARLEVIRREELQLADAASASILDALVRASSVLDAEQRERLLDRIGHHQR